METEACSGHDSYTAILGDEPLQKTLDRLARHRTRFERTFHRCLKELRAVQAKRCEDDATAADMEATSSSKFQNEPNRRHSRSPISKMSSAAWTISRAESSPS
jgi:hypothetical protein